MKNIPRPSRHVLHDEELEKDRKRFDLGTHLRRYSGGRPAWRLIIMLGVLIYLMWFLSNLSR